jgi:uncharacterized membrane protein YvbJ
MYCTNCGTLLGAGARYCGKCGRQAEKHRAPAPEETGNAPRRNRIIKPDRLDKTVGVVLAVVVGLTLLVYALGFTVPFLQGFVEGFVDGLGNP